jgi:hypothetical protein
MTEREAFGTTKFMYLLNAMENAAAEDNPFEHDYAGKRAAVLAYVADLEASQASAADEGREPTMAERFGIEAERDTTPPQPACSQKERDMELLEVCNNPSTVFYGPHECPNGCKAKVCRVSLEQGGMILNYPEGIIYPNTNWVQHVCEATPPQPADDPVFVGGKCPTCGVNMNDVTKATPPQRYMVNPSDEGKRPHLECPDCRGSGCVPIPTTPPQPAGMCECGWDWVKHCAGEICPQRNGKFQKATPPQPVGDGRPFGRCIIKIHPGLHHESPQCQGWREVTPPQQVAAQDEGQVIFGEIGEFDATATCLAAALEVAVPAEPTYPLAISNEQLSVIKSWADDTRNLWGNNEAREHNLTLIVRMVLKLEREAAERENATLRERNEELQKALEKYGKHAKQCASWQIRRTGLITQDSAINKMMQACNCGLSAALAPSAERKQNG